MCIEIGQGKELNFYFNFIGAVSFILKNGEIKFKQTGIWMFK